MPGTTYCTFFQQPCPDLSLAYTLENSLKKSTIFKRTCHLPVSIFEVDILVFPGEESKVRKTFFTKEINTSWTSYPIIYRVLYMISSINSKKIQPSKNLTIPNPFPPVSQTLASRKGSDSMAWTRGYKKVTAWNHLVGETGASKDANPSESIHRQIEPLDIKKTFPKMVEPVVLVTFFSGSHGPKGFFEGAHFCDPIGMLKT